jgi:hypothetical protein
VHLAGLNLGSANAEAVIITENVHKDMTRSARIFSLTSHDLAF